jgi:Arc/MetJ family transcription regulator
VIFKRVGDVRPYPDHGYVQKQWAAIAPHQVRLDQLVTTKRTLDLEALLEEDSTFYGDLFAALQQRQTMHARVLQLEG